MANHTTKNVFVAFACLIGLFIVANLYAFAVRRTAMETPKVKIRAPSKILVDARIFREAAHAKKRWAGLNERNIPYIIVFLSTDPLKKNYAKVKQYNKAKRCPKYFHAVLRNAMQFNERTVLISDFEKCMAFARTIDVTVYNVTDEMVLHEMLALKKSRENAKSKDDVFWWGLLTLPLVLRYAREFDEKRFVVLGGDVLVWTSASRFHRNYIHRELAYCIFPPGGANDIASVYSIEGLEDLMHFRNNATGWGWNDMDLLTAYYRQQQTKESIECWGRFPGLPFPEKVALLGSCKLKKVSTPTKYIPGNTCLPFDGGVVMESPHAFKIGHQWNKNGTAALFIWINGFPYARRRDVYEPQPIWAAHFQGYFKRIATLLYRNYSDPLLCREYCECFTYECTNCPKYC